jgi:hypothetical protein
MQEVCFVETSNKSLPDHTAHIPQDGSIHVHAMKVNGGMDVQLHTF